MKTMKKIIIKNNIAFIYLNNNFYDKDIILKTIKVYENFFKTKINETKKYYLLKIEKNINSNENNKNKIKNENNNKNYSLEFLTFEFLNYLLSNQKINS